MLFNRKFDLIISIGEDCACSSYLRRFIFSNKKRRTLIWYINFLIYKFVKLLISLIFIKNVRRKLRTNWQYMCFKAKL